MRATPAWPIVNVEQREAVIAAMASDLLIFGKSSPVRFEDNDAHTEEIVDMLFPGESAPVLRKEQFGVCHALA